MAVHLANFAIQLMLIFCSLPNRADPNDRLLSVPLSQRNLPASFWNYEQSHHHHFQSNLVSDHSHHYLPLIEPSASNSSLQPLLQLETLSQLTHLQNHHSQNSSASSAACATNFTSSQHSAQNSSSLISNPINSLTFAHQHQLAQSAAVQPVAQPALPQPTGSSQPTATVTDLSAQPPFLHFLHQQTNHPFQYAAQNAAAIQSSAEPTSNSLNSQNFQTHHTNLANPYNGSETNNGWPHSVFIPLASPASSSSCSSNAENNANRSNKLASNLTSSSSLAKQYQDHLAKPAARFALTSSALLQLNSAGTSPNRSPLSTTTSSPAQISHNSSTLSPVAFHHSLSNNTAYPLSGSLFPASVNTTQLQASSSSNESTTNTNGYSNSPRSPATTANPSTASATSASNSALAKSFPHLAHQSADPWSHPSNSTQPYLAFHSAAHNLAGYSHTPTNSSSGDKTDGNSTYNQYNSLLLAGSSINGSSLNNATNQSAAATKQAASLTSSNQLPHSLTHPSMPNHLTNYNYYHLNPLNQANALGSASETATPTAISFHHSTANSFHYHYHHHNPSNYNGYNYNYGLMPGK